MTSHPKGGDLLRRKSPHGVLDFLTDTPRHHDDENVKPGDAVVVNISHGEETIEHQQQTQTKRQKTEADVVTVVVKEEPGESPPGNAAVEIGAKTLFPAAPETQETGPHHGVEDDDAVMIVDAPTKTMCTVGPNNATLPHDPTTTTTTTTMEDGVEMIGYANATRLPHHRQHCTETTKYVPLPDIRYRGESFYIPPWAMDGTHGNAEFCDFCYCYVCDKPAKDCQRWSSTEISTTTHNHCHACNEHEGVMANTIVWNELRQVYTRQNTMRTVEEHETIAIRTATRLVQTGEFDRPKLLPMELRQRALSPDDPRIGPYVDVLLWKCRHCGCYTQRGDPPARRPGQQPVFGGPWCYGCGRIASEECFLQEDASTTTTSTSTAATKSAAAPQTKSAATPTTKSTLICQPYQPQPKDIYLGSKVMPFRIKVHDPRKTKPFQKQWASSPEWVYDEAEMEEDMFRHRFGTYPSLHNILNTIQVWRDDDDDETRKDGEEEEEDDDESFAHGSDDEDENEYNAALSFGYTDVILMEKHDRVVLLELQKFDSVGIPGSKQDKVRVAGDITALWNKNERRGEFKVRLYLRENDNFKGDLGTLLGAWFGIFPLPLSDLAGSLRASVTEISIPYFRYPLPPAKCGKIRLGEVVNSAKEEMTTAVATFNSAVEESQAKLSLKSSSGESSRLGGVCTTDTTFLGVMRRYVAEVLPDHVNHQYEGGMISWFGRAAGVTAHHRCVSRNNEDFPHLQDRSTSFESYIRDEDVPLASENLAPECATLQRNTKSINARLIHLENLGHDEAPFVEGLNVELLPFQRQTLQWALDREKNPGGVQSFLWAKLPSVEDKESPDVYYNPLLQRITTKMPKLVRGGIIAEEMGLGKTVISLALILQNPAPPAPVSGCNSDVWISNINNAAECEGWDPEWQRGENESALRGSIMSRGTLVVCHLSLVGQWIEEAKRRLKEPGLVYAYHGQSRKRDAMILAQNSIIVTTYATLAKDATYHANKAAKNGVDDYCPPCEQIRWWRIICDESHALKQETCQTKAVLSLVGDHKWAVSGTPWNTSLLDIKNQLKFVGLQHVDAMLSKFQDTIVSTYGGRRYRQHTSDPNIGQFMFLMRAVMIRHSQNQQYRGTSTTLMSLPPKTERTMLIDFGTEEALEYKQLEKEALTFYEGFKAANWKTISSHYLKLTQRLVPLRIACSGGQIPLVDDSEDHSEDECEAVKPKKKKQPQIFSEFSFQSKFAALMDELKRIRDDEPDSKSLVFSQYASSLKSLQEELPKHGFQFRTLSGDMSLKQRAEALNAFQHDPPTTIFLLSMRAGAVGINLTQANRVFLLEPAMNPALEAQAIGRVHRLGQTRNVEIVRLLMKDSIDTKITKLVQSKFPSTQGTTETKNDASGSSNANAPIVGCMRTDKAAIMGGEFDFLFGMTQSPEQVARAMQEAEDDENSLFSVDGDNVMTDANHESVVPDGIASSGMI